MSQAQTFKEALDIYYSLKSQYENDYDKEKRKIIATPGLSWGEKRIEFQKLKKKCIHCKRPVGTVFGRRVKRDKLDLGEERHVYAFCGDRANPCSLNIDLNLSHFVNVEDVIESDEKEMADLKREIIKDKNNLLFGYISSEEAVNQFDNVKDSLSQVMTNYEFFLNVYNDIVNNKEKKDALKKLEATLFLQITNFKKLVEDYERSQDTQFIIDAVELYKNEIKPTANKIMNNKYRYSAVEYNEAQDIYSLIQKKVTLEQMEIDIGANQQGIVSMKIGDEKFKLRGPIPKAQVAAIPALKNKTGSRKSAAVEPTQVQLAEVLTDSSDEEELESEDEEED